MIHIEKVFLLLLNLNKCQLNVLCSEQILIISLISNLYLKGICDHLLIDLCLLPINDLVLLLLVLEYRDGLSLMNQVLEIMFIQYT